MPAEKTQKQEIDKIIREEACFDLQFRKDTKHNRTYSPTYYRWNIQFVITQNEADKNILEKIKNVFGCGKIHLINKRARYSVQNLDEIKSAVIPYFRAHPVAESKENDFKLWIEAVEIIHKNKRASLSSWNKKELTRLLKIQKDIQEFKKKPRGSKWLDVAKSMATLPNNN